MQTKKQSLIESFTSTFVGFLISLVATFLIMPAFNIETTPAKNVGLTIFFTTLSMIRTYFIRRVFSRKEEKKD